jgi:membrane fusion protein (multidrug efflux system)
VRIVKDGILIPQRCVMELQGLHNVYVVDASNNAEIREITVGPKVGSNWLIAEGLKPGETVVFEGLQKVKDGIEVKPTVADLNSTDQKKK